MTIYARTIDVEAASVTAQIENDFDFLSDEYRTLFRQSGATAFQGPLWLHCLYSTLAPRLGASPLIVTARDSASGALKMVLPLAIQRSLEIRIAQPADLGVSDYNAIVAAPETLASLASERIFLKQLRRQLLQGDVLIFRKIRGCPAATASIVGQGPSGSNDNDAYEIRFSGDSFEEWQRASLKKKFRNGTQRRLRAMQERHDRVQFRTFTDATEIEAAIAFIAASRSARFRDDILQDRAYRSFYLRVAQEGAAGGEAVTSGLVVDGELVSANFGIVGGGAYHAILCAARLETYGEYAPGLQSMLHLLRARHEAGDERFDFGIGGSRYKKDFAAAAVPLHNLTVASSVSGRMVSLVYNQAKPLKTALRRLVGSIR